MPSVLSKNTTERNSNVAFHRLTVDKPEGMTEYSELASWINGQADETVNAAPIAEVFALPKWEAHKEWLEVCSHYQ